MRACAGAIHSRVMRRSRPPEDISPHEFFTRWVPEAVRGDPARRDRLADTRATIEFRIESASGDRVEVFGIEIADGVVSGTAGELPDPSLRVRTDLETWRALNRGDLAAPQALLSRRIQLEGDFVLGLKLQLILG